jgi:8-oxo-dGTP pyrophosphatase MutT (NUDIX family)
MTIRVVSAVIVSGPRLLLVQRRASDDYPFTWELPGGMVDGKESDHEALARELAEEVAVAPVRIQAAPIWAGHIERHNGREGIFLQMFPVTIRGQELKPLEGQGMGWLTLDDLYKRLAKQDVHAALLRGEVAVKEWVARSVAGGRPS